MNLHGQPISQTRFHLISGKPTKLRMAARGLDRAVRLSCDSALCEMRQMVLRCSCRGRRVASVHVAGVWSVQGCVLANTAIEKYLKALYVHLELSTLHSHAVQALYREVTSSNKCTVA